MSTVLITAKNHTTNGVIEVFGVMQHSTQKMECDSCGIIARKEEMKKTQEGVRKCPVCQ